jgi:hypothetical protein
MYAELITCIKKALQETEVHTPTARIEARGLRGDEDRSRHRDIVVLDYIAPGKQLQLDGVVTTVSRNTRMSETTTIPGFATKLVEDKKLYTDKTSERPVTAIHRGRHTLILFAMEDGGRLGAHAQSFLCFLARRAVHQGRRSRAPSRDLSGAILRGDGATQVSLWVHRWQRHIAAWMYLSLSRQLLRIFCPHQVAESIFS